MTASNQTTVLVLGATGMLGNAMLRLLADSETLNVVGTARNAGAVRLLRPDLQARVRVGVDVENSDSLVELFAQVRPAVAINCVGLVKQLAEADDPHPHAGRRTAHGPSASPAGVRPVECEVPGLERYHGLFMAGACDAFPSRVRRARRVNLRPSARK